MIHKDQVYVLCEEQEMKDLVIIGAGGFGRETAALIHDIKEKETTWTFLGFIDDAVSGKTIEGQPVIGSVNDLSQMDPKPNVVVAIANSNVRETIVTKLKKDGFIFPSIIHPTVTVGPEVTIGEGCIICQNVIFTTNVIVGPFCILNLNCTFGHDTVLEDYISMMSHTAIAGDVHIGKACYFGLHCTVINQKSITEGCTFGAGAVIVHDIKESGTYVGVPARKIK